MILKRGVTGFTAGDLSLERDWDEVRATLKKASYTAVQAAGGRVIEWFDPDVTNPYPHMHVQVKGQKLYIFYNVMYD